MENTMMAVEIFQLLHGSPDTRQDTVQDGNTMCSDLCGWEKGLRNKNKNKDGQSNFAIACRRGSIA